MRSLIFVLIALIELVHGNLLKGLLGESKKSTSNNPSNVNPDGLLNPLNKPVGDVVCVLGLGCYRCPKALLSLLENLVGGLLNNLGIGKDCVYVGKSGGDDEDEETEDEDTEDEETEDEDTEDEETEDEETEYTEPAVTDPAVIEPAVTVPAVTVPAVTDPVVTDPAVTVPAVTDPAVTVPAVTDPAVTVPAVTDPAVTDPAVTDESEYCSQMQHPDRDVEECEDECDPFDDLLSSGCADFDCDDCDNCNCEDDNCDGFDCDLCHLYQ